MNNTEKYSFENFVMQCCKAKEWDLRKFLKKILTRAGFTIKEDNYVSNRDGKYKTIRNMLAIKGNPRVCLVAHTDVCRDHAYDTPDVDPVVKISELRGELRAIIQDRNCDFQLGADDRLGVAISAWIALNYLDVGLLYTTDEEIGLVSAEHVRFPELLNFDLLVQIDRGNHSNQLVNQIGGCQLCSEETTQKLLKIAEDIGIPRTRVNGMMTDVLAIKTNHMCKEAINLCCGYYNSIGAQSNEYIDIQEAKETMKYVASIVKHYYLEDIEENILQGNNIIKQQEQNLMPDNVIKLSKKERRRLRKAMRDGRRNRVYSELWSEENYNRDRRESAHFNDGFGEGRGRLDF